MSLKSPDNHKSTSTKNQGHQQPQPQQPSDPPPSTMVNKNMKTNRIKPRFSLTTSNISMMLRLTSILILCCALLNLLLPTLPQDMTTIDDLFVPHKKDTTSLLRSTLHNAWALIPNPINETDSQRILLANLIPPSKPSVTEDVVMITHGSGGNRLNNLLIQIRWWNGPVAVAVYIKSKKEIDDFLQFIPKLLATQSTQIHVVLEKTKLQYPHNVMRNLVMDHLQSDYFVALDADFVTNPNAHDSILKLIQTSKNVRRRLHSKYVFVLPAFEKYPLDNQTSPTEDMLPRTKEELIQMEKNKTLSIFHNLNTPYSFRGHRPTNFHKWGIGRLDTPGNFFDIKFAEKFEPYVLGYRHGIPRYWSTFRGFGYNKWTWFVELDKAGYKLCTLLDYYVVHINHAVSRNDSLTMTDMNRPHYLEFEKYLKAKYQDEPSGDSSNE